MLSINRHTVFFEIMTSVLQGDTLAPYMFIIYLEYFIRTSLDLIKKKLYFRNGKE